MKNLFTAIERSKTKRFGFRQRLKLGFEPSLQVLEHHGNQAHVSDLVADESVAHEFRPQGAQMHDTRAANKRPDKADHEIDGMVGGQNAQIANARPEGIQRDQRLALFQIILMSEHASLGTSAGARRIDDAGHILTLARNKYGIALAAKIFPAERSRKFRPRRRFGDQNSLHFVVLELRRLHDRAPQVVFDHQKFRLAVRQQLQMLGRGQLVIERHQHATPMKNGVRGNQPLRLIGHDDRGPVAGTEFGVFESARQRHRHFFEIGIGEAGLFLVAIGLDQAGFIRPTVERLPQRRAQAGVLVEIEHE